MALQFFWNRRSGHDRRLYDEIPSADHRAQERRSVGSDDYVLVVGDGGIDGFTLLISIPIACLLASIIVVGLLLS